MTRLRYSNGDEKQERLIDVKLSEGLEDWDFEGADTQYLTHGIHPYPARMIPQIAHRLISRYSHDPQPDPVRPALRLGALHRAT
ncbi:MAG: hypothetical protein QW470_04320, partial [Candidatus Caldarchaeum sp.]